MRWRLPPAAPAQRAATVLLIVATVVNLVLFVAWMLRRAPLSLTPLLALQAATLLSALLGDTRAQWPPRPTPMRLVGAATLVVVVATLALVLAGSLAKVPFWAMMAASLALLGCFRAPSTRRPATPDHERR